LKYCRAEVTWSKKESEFLVKISKTRTMVIKSNGKEDNLEKTDQAENKIRWRLTKSALPRIHEMDKKNQKWLTVIERSLNRAARKVQ
jgi:hypothetical protein